MTTALAGAHWFRLQGRQCVVPVLDVKVPGKQLAQAALAPMVAEAVPAAHKVTRVFPVPVV